MTPQPEELAGERPVPTVPWPTLDPAALYGVAGEIVRLVEPFTEADPAALALQLLAVFGATVDKPYVVVANQQHRALIHPLLIGRTSGGAKGTALALVQAIRRRALPEFDDNVAHGLSTGEGLIELVRDGTSPDDLGVLDKRLLVVETEYRSVLARSRRESNTLGTILRQAWDGDDLRTLTRKRSQLRATRPHIVVVGHVTPRELQAMLTDSDLSGGTVNRLLLCCSQRTRFDASFGNLSDDILGEAATKFAEAHEHAQKRGRVEFSPDFMNSWREAYAELVRDRPETWATEATARGVVQVLRLSLIFALVDRADVVNPEHLGAALAMWQYCEHSARWLFSSVAQEVDRTRSERLAEFILAGGRTGCSRTDINTVHYNGHRTAQQIEAELAPLVHAGTVVEVKVVTGGRPALRYVHRLCERSGETKNAGKAKKAIAAGEKTARKKATAAAKKPRSETRLSTQPKAITAQQRTAADQASSAIPLSPHRGDGPPGGITSTTPGATQRVMDLASKLNEASRNEDRCEDGNAPAVTGQANQGRSDV